RRARFLLETREPFLIVERDRGEDFDRYVAMKPRVTGAVNRAHASLAEKARDLVRPEHLAGLKWHVSNGNSTVGIPPRDIPTDRRERRDQRSHRHDRSSRREPRGAVVDPSTPFAALRSVGMNCGRKLLAEEIAFDPARLLRRVGRAPCQ